MVKIGGKRESSDKRLGSNSKFVIDTVTSIMVAVAAAALVWHSVFTASASRARPNAPERALENIEADGLSTDIDGAIRKGNTRATVAIIEYSDFECPFCGRHARDTFPEIDRQFIASGDVQYVFRNFPLEQKHPSSLRAAEAAECAEAQGQFWNMHKTLFARQPELAGAFWIREAADLGLNAQALKECLGGSMISRVRADFDEGARLGVNSTPTFLIGEVVEGHKVLVLGRVRGAHPFSVFDAALQQVIKTVTGRENA